MYTKVFQILNPIPTFKKTLWRQSLASWITKESEKLIKIDHKTLPQNSEEKNKGKNILTSKLARH